MSKRQLLHVLIVPDCHIPYHDQRAFALMLTAAKATGVDVAIILGDFVDFVAVSGHAKNPREALKLPEEIAAGRRALRQIKALGAAKNVFIAGNHEDRLWRYLVSKAPELAETVTLQSLLRLEKYGFDYVPYRQSFKMGHMRYTHDVGFAGKNAATQSMEAMGRNLVIGHCHRMSYHVMGNLDGGRHVGISLGWLGDVHAIDYMARDKATKDWTLGFGFGYYDPASAYTTIQPVPIMPDYSCIVAGIKFQG
jgi:predicted phosphodiesterase